MTSVTPVWVPLIVASIGLFATIAGTISGVLITQRRSDSREQLAWERERERERESWAREDAARTYERRRDAYIEFYEAADHAMRAIVERYRELAASGLNGGGGPLPDDIFLPVLRTMEKVNVYGSGSVIGVARDMFGTLSLFGYMLAEGKNSTPEDFGRFDRGLQERVKILLDAIRVDLGIPSDGN